MKSLNLYLTAVRALLFLACLGSGLAVPLAAGLAQDAAPLQDIEKPLNTPLDPDIPVIVELFSSQACAFCPRADRLFSDLIKQPHIIGVSCHIDYFDVRQGSLSHPFCTERQSWYVDTLGTGPNYTPQMIVQGQIDVVGYRMESIVAGMQQAAAFPAVRLGITPEENSSLFRVSLSAEIENFSAPGAVLWLALYDKPHKLTVAEGRNRNQNMIYYNVIQDLQNLGPWEQNTGVIEVQANRGHKGFVLLVQDPRTGRILAAGQYEFPRKETAKAGADKTL